MEKKNRGRFFETKMRTKRNGIAVNKCQLKNSEKHSRPNHALSDTKKKLISLPIAKFYLHSQHRSRSLTATGDRSRKNNIGGSRRKDYIITIFHTSLAAYSA